MSDRRLFVPPERLAGSRVTLTGDEHRHLGRVLRARPGMAVTLFDGAGGEVAARVERVGRDETELALGERRTPAAPPATPITLLTAVPRGARMDLLVQKTCELGVARIVPLVTERSVVRPEPGRRGSGVRWETVAREAARQCGRADLPIVDAPATLAAALGLPGLPARRLVLWERLSGRSLRSTLGAPAPTALLVGPEGGFAPGEVAAAEAAGFVPVALGPRILRVETAAIVAVALVAEANGDLG
jgi:16S rRNA (uracil1498-N3)-methyltransferase